MLATNGISDLPALSFSPARARNPCTADGLAKVTTSTGGTGVAPRDQTPEAVAGLFTKELPGFGELFRMLSYQEIGTAALLSRAVGGLMGRIVLLTMPGSPDAVRLAMDQVILPEHEAGQQQQRAR